MFSQQLAKFKNETKIKTSLRARGPPGVSGALRSLRILPIERSKGLFHLFKCPNKKSDILEKEHHTSPQPAPQNHNSMYCMSHSNADAFLSNYH